MKLKGIRALIRKKGYIPASICSSELPDESKMLEPHFVSENSERKSGDFLCEICIYIRFVVFISECFAESIQLVRYSFYI